MSRANSGLSNHVKDTCRSRADRSTLIKAQLSALNVATIGHKRDIGYDGGYTLQPVCARPAEKARSRQHPMCPINFRWEETYTPTMHSASLTLAHNALHSPSIITQIIDMRICRLDQIRSAEEAGRG